MNSARLRFLWAAALPCALGHLGCGGSRTGSANWAALDYDVGSPASKDVHIPAEVVASADIGTPADVADASCHWTGGMEPPELTDDGCEFELQVDGFIQVCPGTFMMGGDPTNEFTSGNELPTRKVTITRPFSIQATEVTVGEWKSVVGSRPNPADDCYQCPVRYVSATDAAHYLNLLSDREGLPRCYELIGCDGIVGQGCPGPALDCDANASCTYLFKGMDCAGYRLPTEAEWEYAARAGSTEPLHGPQYSIGWFTTPDNDMLTPGPVGMFQPNAWGLYDVNGNLTEMCLDGYADTFVGAPLVDPLCIARHGRTAIRGVNWGYGSEARVSRRAPIRWTNRTNWVGFRAARNATR
ncbi:MAG: formylglycine-generating enzyme family protein [Myxococcales bacterium]|nr:formylglycine-generating enzyme family protein [Myxococcales bacterium]